MAKLTRRLMLFMVAMTMIFALVGCKTSTVEKPAEKPKETTQTKKDAQEKPKTHKFSFEFKDGKVIDSAGREVTLPKEIKKIAPSGNMAQVMLYTVEPGKMVGWAKTPSKLQQKYLEDKYKTLPEFGSFYGKNANMNLEAIIKAKPDVIIDIGQKKKTIKEDMDGVQKQTGIPTIFIEAELDTLKDAYYTLGKILGNEAQGKALGDYAQKTLDMAKENLAKIPEDKRVKVYYGEGENGLQTNPVGSIHAEVIDLVGGKNVAKIPETSGAGGNTISMEQIIGWKPDVLLFGPGSMFGKVDNDPLWKDLAPVKDKKVYEVPQGPYNFMGRPPSVNRLIGIKWLGNLLYPDVYKMDMVKEVQEFYKLFYHYDLKENDAKELLKNSTFLGK